MTDEQEYLVIKVAEALKHKFGLRFHTPPLQYFDESGSLREDVYVIDVRDDDNETISHAFSAKSDEHAIKVATHIVQHQYHRELAAENCIDVMKPMRDDDNKAYYDECDFDCIYSFELEAA